MKKLFFSIAASFVLIIICHTNSWAPGGTPLVRGIVKDASTDLVISGALVKTTDGVSATLSDPDGKYTLAHAAGTVGIQAEKASYNIFNDTVTFLSSETVIKDIYMTPTDTSPTADFTGTPTSGTAPLTVNFTNSSAGGDAPLSYAWDFENNGSTDSTAQNPSKVYSNGTYSVKLTVTDSDGDTDTLTRTNYITVCYSNANIVGDSTAYSTLQSAYDAAATGNTLEGRDVTITEDVNLNRNMTVTIQGGYNCDHSAVSGKTAINGNMTISDGTVTMENVQVQ